MKMESPLFPTTSAESKNKSGFFSLKMFERQFAKIIYLFSASFDGVSLYAIEWLLLIDKMF